jgi:peroxiredoxin Q/BCP
MSEKELDIGDSAPDFCLPNQEGKEVCLEEHRGKWVVLYFTLNKEAFDELGAVVIGVSPDSVKSHERFCQKNNLTITLLSDPDHGVLEEYGVWQLKKMYGREYHGVVRSTFLVDPKGKVAHAWRKVRVANHVETVKAKLAELK